MSTADVPAAFAADLHAFSDSTGWELVKSGVRCVFHKRCESLTHSLLVLGGGGGGGSGGVLAEVPVEQSSSVQIDCSTQGVLWVSPRDGRLSASASSLAALGR